MTWPQRTFAEAFTQVSDRGVRVQRREYLPKGALPVVDQGVALIGGYSDDLAARTDTDGPVIVFGDHTRRVKYVNFPFAVGADGVKVLQPASVLDPKFAYWFLQSVRLPDRGYGRHFALLREIAVPVPPLEEQRRIVNILEDHLSRLDAADKDLSLSLAKLKKLRERTISHALTAADMPDRVDAELTDVGTSDDDLPSLPVGWSWARLGDVAHVVGGVTKDSKKQSDPSFVEVPYLRVANVQRGHLNLEILTHIRVDPTKAKALRLEEGDVLLNEGGDRDKLARGWVWEGHIDDCIHQNHVFRARLHEARLNPYFLSWTANTFGGRWAERNGKQSVNLASISLSMIRKMPVIAS